MKGDAQLLAGFRIRDREVHPGLGVIRYAGRDLHVEPRFMDVLVCLAAHAGEVVSRDTLIDEVWGRKAVTDDSINKSVSQLRSYLGDTDRERRILETVPKRGYRLIAPVELLRVTNAAPTNTREPAATTRSRASLSAQLAVGLVAGLVAALLVIFVPRWTDLSENSQLASTFDPPEGSVAILPFSDVSIDGGTPYLGDGIAEDLIQAVGHAEGLTAIARSSSFAVRDRDLTVREIGRLLNVQAVLQGTVRTTGDQMRISASLVDTRDEFPLWSHTFDIVAGEYFDITDSIARAVDEALRVTGPVAARFDPPTRNLDAYELFLQGRYYLHLRTSESLALAAEFFRQSTRLDPDFALAYSGLSDALVFSVLYGGVSVTAVDAEAGASNSRALELAPELSQVHASAGLYQLYVRGDSKASMAAHAKAAELDPNNVDELRYFAVGSIGRGDFRSAQEALELARTLDPLSQSVIATLLDVYMLTGEYGQANDLFRDAPRLEPHGAHLLRNMATWLGAYGDVERGRVLAGQALQKDPNGPLTIAAMAYLEMLDGNLDQALALLDAPDGPPRDSISGVAYRARVHAARGEHEAALALASSVLAQSQSPGEAANIYLTFWSAYYSGVAAMLCGYDDQAVGFLRQAGEIVDTGSVGEVLILAEYYLYSANAYMNVGDTENARAFLEQAHDMIVTARRQNYGNSQFYYVEASYYALARESDLALQSLAKANAEGRTSGRRGSWKGAWFLESDPNFASMRSMPEFEAILTAIAR